MIGRFVFDHRGRSAMHGVLDGDAGTDNLTGASPMTDMNQAVDPRTVLSPMRSVTDLRVIHDGGIWREDDRLWSGWSVCELNWQGEPAVGCRWNGELGVTPGSPSSRGYPTWFIIPEPLASVVIEVVNTHLNSPDHPDRRYNRLGRCVNELLAAARDATPEELTRLQLHL